MTTHFRALACTLMLAATAGALGQVSPAQPANAVTQALEDALVAQIVADLPGSLVTQHSQPQSLQARMAAVGVPAVSVAVFRDGQLAWARAWGRRHAADGGQVDTGTLFQAASISKPVAAFGALVLANGGQLSLDQDIGSMVPGWQAATAITPRQLLSHTAGLGVSGFPGYAAGQRVPTAAQVLAGAAPANTAAVQVDGPVGQQARYSGGGYVVLQALLEAQTGQPFADLMHSRVLAPLGMALSSFRPPLRAADASQAASGNLIAGNSATGHAATRNVASGHRQGQPVAGGWHSYPELAAAGLWTTPSDLSRVATALQDHLAGRPSPLLSPAIARQMLTAQAGGFGLGWVLDTRAGERVFGHTGLNEGFEALLAASASPSSPQHAVVVMTNGQGGTALAQALLRAVARAVGWAAYAPRQVVAQTLPSADLAALEGLYRGPGRSVAVEVLNGVAHLRDGGWQRAPLVPLSATRFAVENRSIDLVFGPPGVDGPRGLVLDGDGPAVSLQQQPLPLAAETSVPLLLRGSMNNRGTAHAFSPEGSARWALTLTLDAGLAEFKVAADDWSRLNLGAALSAPPLQLGQDARLAPMGDNLRLMVGQPGRYRFTVSGADPQRPQLQVQHQPN